MRSVCWPLERRGAAAAPVRFFSLAILTESSKEGITTITTTAAAAESRREKGGGGREGGREVGSWHGRAGKSGRAALLVEMARRAHFTPPSE